MSKQSDENYFNILASDFVGLPTNSSRKGLWSEDSTVVGGARRDSEDNGK